MKNTILAFVLLFLGGSAFAQGTIDLKTSPLRPVFQKNGSLLVEYGINPNVGVELGARSTFGSVTVEDIDFKRSGAVIYAAGHYYFKPDHGADNFSAGVYFRTRATKFGAENATEVNEDFNWNRTALGLIGGYKWVGQNNLIFELDLGIGRAINNKIDYVDKENSSLNTTEFSDLNLTALPGINIDLPGRIMVGYRFGGKRSA